MGAKLSSGGGNKRGQLDVTSEPNVIPFIDIMLVLLIIFMVAAPIATVDIKVEMPATKNILASKRPPKPTWVSLKQDEAGALRAYVMNDEVEFGEIGQKIKDAVIANDPRHSTDDLDVYGTRIYLRADAQTKYRNVVRVMNEIQNGGFVRVAFVTEDRRR